MTDRAIWVARHPSVAVHGVCYGRTDVPIAGTIEAASEQLAGTFPGTPRSIVWSSPSSRCADVATALAARWTADVRIDARLFEVDFGAWEGRTWSSLAHEEPEAYAAWMANWKETAPPRGEPLRALTDRVESWLGQWRGASKTAPTGRHALVAHAGVIRALLVLLEGASWEDAMGREIPHLAWRRLET